MPILASAIETFSKILVDFSIRVIVINIRYLNATSQQRVAFTIIVMGGLIIQ